MYRLSNRQPLRRAEYIGVRHGDAVNPTIEVLSQHTARRLTASRTVWVHIRQILAVQLRDVNKLVTEALMQALVNSAEHLAALLDLSHHGTHRAGCRRVAGHSLSCSCELLPCVNQRPQQFLQYLTWFLERRRVKRFLQLVRRHLCVDPYAGFQLDIALEPAVFGFEASLQRSERT